MPAVGPPFPSNLLNIPAIQTSITLPAPIFPPAIGRDHSRRPIALNTNQPLRIAYRTTHRRIIFFASHSYASQMSLFCAIGTLALPDPTKPHPATPRRNSKIACTIGAHAMPILAAPNPTEPHHTQPDLATPRLAVPKPIKKITVPLAPKPYQAMPNHAPPRPTMPGQTKPRRAPCLKIERSLRHWRPCPASPCRTKPDRAMPRHASPRLAPPCPAMPDPAGAAKLEFNPMRDWRPCLTLPDRARPRPGGPCRNSKDRCTIGALAMPRLTEPSHAVPNQALPCRATPCLGPPNPAPPRRAEPFSAEN